ncbi:unnamed protein product [Ascophyllum nodosum]
MYAPACVRLRVRCASGWAARGRQAEPEDAGRSEELWLTPG